MKVVAITLASLLCATAATAQGSSSDARTVYGARLTGPDAEDDPTDRRVLKRIDTRLNNRLETRIERYRFIDPRSGDTSGTAPNPYRPKPTQAPATAGSSSISGAIPRSQ